MQIKKKSIDYLSVFLLRNVKETVKETELVSILGG